MARYQVDHDQAINLMRELRKEIDTKLGLLAHMVLHMRYTEQAQAERIEELKGKLDNSGRFLSVLANVSRPSTEARYQRILRGARNRVRDGHNTLADILLTTLIEEMEHGTDEGVGDNQG